MSNSQDRIFGYDLIKTIAIIIIVFYHLGGIDYGDIETGHFYLPNLNKFLSALCAAGVPLFFMVNGALVIPKNLHWKQLLFKVFHLLFLFLADVKHIDKISCLILGNQALDDRGRHIARADESDFFHCYCLLYFRLRNCCFCSR